MKITKPRFFAKLFLSLLFVLPAIVGSAQEIKPYVEVSGIAEYKADPVLFIADFVVSPTADYSYGSSGSIEEIKKSFLQMIKQLGLKEEEFVEDKMLFYLTEIQGEGTQYRFETKDRNTFFKAKDLEKVRGVRMQTKRIQYKVAESQKELLAKAIADAQSKAKDAAAQMGRKLGSILTLFDANNMQTIEEYAKNYSLYNAGKNYYQISVRYNVE